MKIHKNDQVKIISGKNKGKTGKVIQVFSTLDKVVVEGQNIMIKNLRPRGGKEKGQKIEFSAPLNISKVRLLCPKCGQMARIGYKLTDDNEQGTSRKFRICKKCGQVI